MITATLIDVMGDDLTPVRAAKVSFDNDADVEPEGWEWEELPCIGRDQPILTPQQKRLIGYLARGMTEAEFEALAEEIKYYAGDFDEGNEWALGKIKELLWKFRRTPTHAAPFGHAFMSFRVESPVFVARQLVKHEYLRMSEVSRRYVKGDPVYWKPDTWHGIADNVKQGAGGVLDEWGTDQADCDYYIAVSNCEESYKEMINYLAPEEARIVLPLCHMTRWYWSGSLDAFANMCNLRLDDHAQGATREVANMVSDQARMAFPVSWAALVGDR
jgi:thymidylate synthase (FAD)